MVEQYHFFPCEIFQYDYLAVDGEFSVGFLTTHKGSLRFHAGNLGNVPQRTPISILTKKSDVPGFKIEILSAYPVIEDPKIRQACKKLCSIEELTDNQVIGAIRSITKKEFSEVKRYLPQKAYTQWCISSGLGFLSLDDYLMSTHFNDMFNDWALSLQEFNGLEKRYPDLKEKGTPEHGVYFGSEASEQITKLLKPVVGACNEISDTDLPKHIPAAICNNAIELLEASFAYCGLVYLPIENTGQSILLDVAEHIGVTVYEAHEPRTIWDISTPCIVYGRNSKNSQWQTLLESIKAGYPFFNTPMGIALKNSGKGLNIGLNKAGAKYEIPSEKAIEYAERIKNAFSQREPYRKTTILKAGSKEHTYRGIVVGCEKDLISVVHLCETLVWICPENEVAET